MSRLWHAAIAVLAAFGVVSSAVLVIDNGGSLLNMFSYFTIQSNILMALAAALVASRVDTGGTVVGMVRLGGLVAITITGIVFSTFLHGAIELQGLEWWNDRILHYMVPAMAVIGFVVFRPRTPFARSADLFIVWPIAWLAYTLVRAEVADPHFRGENGTTMDVPYDFLSADLHSVGYVAVFCVVVLVLALAIAAGYRWLSRQDSARAEHPVPGV